MRVLVLLASLWLMCQPAHAVTFTKDTVSVERSSLRYVYTGKTFFFGYFVILESHHPNKYTQLTADLASWRDSRSLTHDGSPLVATATNMVLDSGYVTGWLNDGKYDIVTSPMTNMTLLEQNSAINVITSLTECKVFRSGKNYVDYKCN